MKKLLFFLLFVIPISLFSQTTVTFSDTAVAHSEGIGLNVSCRSYPHWDYSGLISNMVPVPSFEFHLSYNYLWTKTNCTWVANSSDPYQGNQSARVTSSGTDISPSYLENLIGWNKYFRSDKQYELSVALKKEADFGTNQISLKVGSIYESPKFDITSDWQVYTYTFTGDNSSSPALQVRFHGVGDVHVDDVQIHISPNTRDDKYNTTMYNLITELQPATLRWGALTSNVFSLYDPYSPGDFNWSTGYPGSNLTIADYVKLCNDMGVHSNITVGIKTTTDYLYKPETFTYLVDYLGGDTTTELGAIREAEGYSELLSGSKGIILEFGNEVWGGASHNAPWTDGTLYADWARNGVEKMKESDAYDRSKFYFTYSGRHVQMAEWNEEVLVDDTIGDWLAVSGYMGGNFDYDPEIPFESELEYYKSGMAYTQSQITKMNTAREYMLENNGKVYPMYMYEGNMTTDTYYGKYGQAIAYIDYCATMINTGGLVMPTIFNTNQSRWKIIDLSDFAYKKLPLYFAAKLFNEHCKGAVLKTYVNGPTMAGTFGIELTFNKISSYVFSDGTDYSMFLLNRDYENDQDVTINLPAGTFNNNATIYTITADNWNVTDEDSVSVSEISISDFNTGKTITIPKHSFSIVSFTGDDPGVSSYPGYYYSTAVDSFYAYFDNDISTIDTDAGYVIIKVDVFPENATNPYYYYRILEDESSTTGFISQTSGLFFASSEDDGNGVVRVAVIPYDNPALADTLEITITNQVSDVDLINNSSSQMQIYPNPTSGLLIIDFERTDNSKLNLEITNLKGQSVYSREFKSGIIKEEIDISSFSKGIYIVKVHNDAFVETSKLILE